MTFLWPFFTYYGGKWRLAPRYPKPLHKTIIESHAGSAGFSLRYPDRKVVLCERDPLLVALWQWLIRVPAKDIRALPLIGMDQTVEDLKCGPEARWLIGFWLNKGMTAPCRRPSKWMREGWRPNSQWGSVIRERIASQVERIRHWQVLEGAHLAPDVEATWFVDPPYTGEPGRRYRHHRMDYQALGEWCRSRKGQVIVCENVGATWLPFRPFVRGKGTEGPKRTGKSHEAVWYRETGP